MKRKDFINKIKESSINNLLIEKSKMIIIGNFIMTERNGEFFLYEETNKKNNLLFNSFSENSCFRRFLELVSNKYNLEFS